MFHNILKVVRSCILCFTSDISISFSPRVFSPMSSKIIEFRIWTFARSESHVPSRSLASWATGHYRVSFKEHSKGRLNISLEGSAPSFEETAKWNSEMDQDCDSNSLVQRGPVRVQNSGSGELPNQGLTNPNFNGGPDFHILICFSNRQ